MRPGEIYLAQFPFGDAPGMKIRPVLLLTDPMAPHRRYWLHTFPRSFPLDFCLPTSSSTRLSLNFAPRTLRHRRHCACTSSPPSIAPAWRAFWASWITLRRGQWHQSLKTFSSCRPRAAATARKKNAGAAEKTVTSDEWQVLGIRCRVIGVRTRAIGTEFTPLVSTKSTLMHACSPCTV